MKREEDPLNHFFAAEPSSITSTTPGRRASTMGA